MSIVGGRKYVKYGYGSGQNRAVAVGNWQVVKDGAVVSTVTVVDGTNLLTFTAEAGNYVIAPTN